MPVYVIADIEVLDATFVRASTARRCPPPSPPRRAWRGGATQVLEGDWSPRRCVMLEFPDMAHFQAWWGLAQYAPLRELRRRRRTRGWW